MKTIKHNFLLFLMVSFLFTACSEDEINEDNNQNPTTTLENPNPAANNADIVNQSTWGNRANIWNVKTHNNNLYAIGVVNGDVSFMRLNQSGEIVWSRATNLRGGSFFVTNQNIFVVGNYSTGGSSINNRTKIKAYNLNGDFITEYDLHLSSYERTILNDITVLDNGKIVVGGFVQSGEIQYPLLFKLSLTNNTLVSFAPPLPGSLPNQYDFSDYARQRVINLKNNGNNIYFTTNEYVSNVDEPSKINLFKVEDAEGSAFTYQNRTTIVSDNIEHKVFTTTISNLIYYQNNIYITGTTDDNKTPGPGSGGFWRSGFLIKVSEGGQIVWKKVLSVSDKSDRTYSSVIHNNFIYTFGEHSGIRFTSSNADFGNGLINKLDLNGNTIFTKTFGDKTKRSVFNTGIVHNGSLMGMGYIQNSNNNQEYQAWVLQTNQ